MKGKKTQEKAPTAATVDAWLDKNVGLVFVS